MRRPWTIAIVLTLALTGVAATGCAILGVAANAIPKAPIKPKVILADQRVGVMVWCDRATTIDWPSIQIDLSGAVQARLIQARDAKAKEMLNVVLPWPPASFARWQQDHPGYEVQPITDVAPRLQVTRLIYVELEDFATRSSHAMALYRGTASATIKVVEVPPTAPGATQPSAGKVIYEEPHVQVVFPKHSTEDGSPDGDDNKMYIGTINALADQIAYRFIEHPAEDD